MPPISTTVLNTLALTVSKVIFVIIVIIVIIIIIIIILIIIICCILNYTIRVELGMQNYSVLWECNECYFDG